MTEIGVVFGHRFVGFKDDERICWTCGYVVPRLGDPKAFILAHEDGVEVHCGGAWHVFKRRRGRND